MEGTTLSHYRILQPVGAGGMGVVYKAMDTRLDRVVALKFLPQMVAGDDLQKARFLQEARAVSGLDHPNICTIHEVDETDQGGLFFAMAFYEGETLKARIERGPLAIHDALDVAIQIAQGLAKAHDAGIVHRDVKPGNVMLTPDGLVKILDFGLAKIADGRTSMTQLGTAVGTVSHMSPEQVLGRPVDTRSDIWALGVVLYECVTGQLPFQGETNLATSTAILHAMPTPLTGMRVGVPVEVERVVGRALAKNSDDRYQTVKDMLSELRRIKRDSDGEVSVDAVSAARPRFRPETESSDDLEYHEAIRSARQRIWIHQTWFPGIERDAAEVLQPDVADLRILLASFKEGAPIYARMAGRRIKPGRGKANVESSVRLFIEAGLGDRLRFGRAIIRAGLP
jgi:serine/threonine protein kinase